MCACEDGGVRTLDPSMAFPMEMDRLPKRARAASHKRAVVAAGLGAMGVHRSVIHPRFASFVLLGTVLLAHDAAHDAPVKTNPGLG